jgi:hypothetical protein
MKLTVDHNLNHFVLIDKGKTEHTIDCFEASKLYYSKGATFTDTAKTALEELEYEEAMAHYLNLKEKK